MNIPSEIEIYNYCITKGFPEPGDFLFSMNVDPKMFATLSFLKLITDSCEINIEDCSSIKDYSITQNFPIFKGMSLYTPEGSVDGVVSKVRKKIVSTYAVEGTFYMEGRARKGHSGSPLFSNTKDIVGIAKKH